ncbi:MAG: biotin--[acetyl-CoA-carboxylase] ligase [Thermoanaerobacteraceae bacterium]|nr:biotin--[acetyl-CoA-carboxylase] ligase [Thermoanaerobacteraceae bacterium]
MKEKILQLLKNQEGQFVSGEDISRQMNVSRTAIWKHISSLRKEGYDIQSVPKRGYRLNNIPDKLYEQEIKPLLHAEVIGRRIYHYEAISSTNDRLKELGDQGAAEGTVVVCEQQLSGKGRLGRSWFSPKGAGIWCSVLLRPEVQPQYASKLTLLGAVAVTEGIKDVCGRAPGIKWPNDLLFSGKKVCGLLTEMRAELDSIDYVVIGFGINVKPVAFPAEFKDRAISLEEALGEKVDRVSLLARILEALERNYILFKESGFKPIRQKWQQYNVTLGNKVVITAHQERISGKAVAISERGGLVIETDGGERQEFLSGEVTLRE